MNVESIPVPPERIPPVANDMSGSSKVVAGVLFFVTIIIAIAMLGALGEDKAKTRQFGDSAEEAGYKVGQVIAVILFAGVPAWFAFRSARNASRATRAAKLAASDAKYTWRLSGKYIIGADPAGVPQPELTFKVNAKNRTMLLAVPRAEVVDRPG
jgi:hypothetical protein